MKNSTRRIHVKYGLQEFRISGFGNPRNRIFRVFIIYGNLAFVAETPRMAEQESEDEKYESKDDFHPETSLPSTQRVHPLRVRAKISTYAMDVQRRISVKELRHHHVIIDEEGPNCIEQNGALQ